MEGREVTVGGRTVWIAEAGEGAPLLYLHGFCDVHGAVADFLPFHRALAERRRLIAPAHPGDPIFCDEQLVGAVTSAAFGHRVGKNLAMGYLPIDQAQPGTRVDIEILGSRYPADILKGPAYDPDNHCPRQ